MVRSSQIINYLNTSTGHAPAYKFDASGVFQIWQPGDIGFESDNFYRNSRAKYFLPSADEWYKAAYFDPTTNVYYDYPTGSNVVPDGIDFPGDPNFDAVFADSAINNAPNDITNVGVPSPYRTFGQGGNNSEWEESAYDLVNDSNTSARGHRGGNWNVRPFASPFLHSSYRSQGNPAEKYFTLGFRVASKAVPEPSAILLGELASAGLLLRRRLAADFSVASAI